MFLHLGADVVVNLKRVIAILDLHSAKEGDATREFLSHANGQRRLVDITGGETKSAVLTDTEIYLSSISSMTLKKRADFLSGTVTTDLGA